jgi:FAD/FMN-containing dehydrogenase
VLWIGCLPSHLAPALSRIERTTAELGARALIHPGIAYATITFDEVPRPAMEELERGLRESRTKARWRNANGLASELPRGLPLMQNLKRALDPQGLFAPGRFHGI